MLTRPAGRRILSELEWSAASAQLASIYEVPQAKKKAFEAQQTVKLTVWLGPAGARAPKPRSRQANWSDQARLAQRQPGYEWTRTYKANPHIFNA